MPATTSVPKNIKELEKANKEKKHGWSQKQIIAIAYSQKKAMEKKKECCK